MNFDFLKGLRGLGHVYENCINAEKLARTMPVQSEFTARKSAELLAKFIYMAAHNREMENLDFLGILSDATVKKFINNRDVMDAFHYIRKNGNLAVHSDCQDTAEDAIAVLQDLHYVAGETACMLGLIEDYPLFEDQISSFPEAQFVDDDDINKKAHEMFLEYVEEFNAQQEREKYIDLESDELIRYSVEGNVEMHEYLEFGCRPKQTELIEYIKNYLYRLLRMSYERSPEKAKESYIGYPVTLNARLLIEGCEYISCDTENFIDAIENKLPEANGFILDIECDGVLREFFNDDPDESDDPRINMIRKDDVWTGAGMLDTLQQYKRRNPFEYKLAVFYPDSGEFRHEKITKGREVDVLSTCNEEIVDRVFDEEWWSFSLDLYVNFDFEEYNDILMKLQEIVRTGIPQSEVRYCENAWQDGELYYLCNGIQWNCTCLREVQNFLDKLNEVLLPIEENIGVYGAGIWEIKSKFAVATWDWTDEGFKVKGICY